MGPNQRERRLEKRALKRKGNQKARRQAHRALIEHPEEAHLEPEPDYGRFRTADLNGQDHDATRRGGEKRETSTSQGADFAWETGRDSEPVPLFSQPHGAHVAPSSSPETGDEEQQ